MREIIIEKLMFFVYIFCLFSLLVPLFGFMLYGKRGVKYLAEKARLKKKEKRFSNILGILFLALLIYIGSWLGAIGLWSSLVIENIKEAGMVKIWQPGFSFVIAMPVLYIILAMIQRRWIRKKIEAEQMNEKSTEAK